MTGSAPAMMVNLVKRFPILHGGGKRIVFQQKAECADTVLAGHRNDTLQNIHVTEFGRTHVLKIQRRVLVKLHVRSRIIAAMKSGGFHARAMRLVGIDERKQRVHSGTLAHVRKHRIQIPLRERSHADGHGDHGGRFGRS